MSGLLQLSGGGFNLTDSGRTVMTSDGMLINLLPPEHDFTQTVSVAFPDFTKNWAYNWNWGIIRYGTNNWGYGNGCVSAQTVPKQDFEQETILAAAPPGADIFLSMIRLTRTAAPSHTWGGSSIDPLPKMGDWMPFSGSVLVEAELGMGRVFSLYLAGGNLVLHRQQSVSNPPAGWGVYGDSTGGPGAKTGGKWDHGGQQGIPVYTIQTLGSPIYPETNGGLAPASDKALGSPTGCSLAATTNFASTYQVEIIGKFGRRS